MNLKRFWKEDYLKLMWKEEVPETNQNHIIFEIYWFDFHPDTITEKLSINPQLIKVKWTEFIKYNWEKSVYEDNLWRYEIKRHWNDFLTDRLDIFVNNVIYPKIDILKEISKNSKLMLTIVQYYYTWFNPWYHFNLKTLKILSDISCEIDMDIYCLNE